MAFQENRNEGTPMSEALRAENLRKSYNGHQVLDGISIKIDKGEIVSILGPSGTGKTTLLRCLGLLEDRYEGSIYIAGNPAIGMNDRAHLRQRLGFVFQDLNLWPHKTALENVIEGLIVVKRMDKSKAVEKGIDALAMVNLQDKTGRYPFELSGGEKQRVAIARAMVMDPEILLVDEITSSLDPELVGEILEIIKTLAVVGKTIVSISHELPFVRNISSRVLFLYNGKIEAEGDPEFLFSECKSEPFRKFIHKFAQTNLATS
jgi:ABC-type polar amino acid transport system ATPase subunit